MFWNMIYIKVSSRWKITLWLKKARAHSRSQPKCGFGELLHPQPKYTANITKGPGPPRQTQKHFTSWHTRTERGRCQRLRNLLQQLQLLHHKRLTFLVPIPNWFAKGDPTRIGGSVPNMNHHYHDQVWILSGDLVFLLLQNYTCKQIKANGTCRAAPTGHKVRHVL